MPFSFPIPCISSAWTKGKAGSSWKMPFPRRDALFGMSQGKDTPEEVFPGLESNICQWQRVDGLLLLGVM